MNKKALLLAGLLGITPLADAQFGGATEITQVLNNVALINQTLQMYQMVQQAIEQVQMAKQQLQNLVSAPAQAWGQARQELDALANIVSKTNALMHAGANIDEMFKLKFPGYAKTTASSNFGSKFQGLVQTQLDGLNSALQVAGLQTNQFANERTTLAQIQGISASSPGSLQALQAGNMIASQTIDQLQKLRQLTMTQMQAQNAYLAGQAQIQADQTDAVQTFMNQSSGKVRKWGESGFTGFGTKNQ